jgi:gas vesicle protein
MAYEYDRFEREDGGGSFLMGLLAGTVLGAGLGMLFAPKAGTDLRNQLTEQAGKLKTTANDTYQQASGRVSQIVDRGREAYDRARGSASEVASEVSDTAEKIASAARQAGESVGRQTGTGPTSVPGSSNRF